MAVFFVIPIYNLSLGLWGQALHAVIETGEALPVWSLEALK